MPTPADFTKISGDIVKNMVLAKIKGELGGELDRISTLFKEACGTIAGHGVVAEINKNANLHIGEIFPDVKLEVRLPDGKDLKIDNVFESDLSMTIRDTNFPEVAQPIESQGHGIYRQAIFSLLSSIKKNEFIERFGENIEKKKDYLILLEEPEIYLHPSALERMRKSIYEIASNSPFQVLCASHSPSLINLERSHTSIALVSRMDSEYLRIYQSERTLFEDEVETRDRIKMLLRFNPHLCEVFFSSEVILVEGDTEAVVIRNILSKIKGRDIFVLNSGTKMNMPFFQKVLTHFRIKHHIIHDCDDKFTCRDNGRIVNPAWSINESIWREVQNANNVIENLACRYVHVLDFETASGYSLAGEKSKPFAAYKKMAHLEIQSDHQICRFLRQILGKDERGSNYEPEALEKLYTEYSETPGGPSKAA